MVDAGANAAFRKPTSRAVCSTLCALVVDGTPERQENVTSEGENGCFTLSCGLRLHGRYCAALASGPLTGPRHPPVRLYNVHLRIMSAFARAGSLGFFVLALRVPTCLTPPVLPL